jgi:hypothetical protein
VLPEVPQPRVRQGPDNLREEAPEEAPDWSGGPRGFKESLLGLGKRKESFEKVGTFDRRTWGVDYLVRIYNCGSKKEFMECVGWIEYWLSLVFLLRLPHGSR